MNNYIEELGHNGYVFCHEVPRSIIHINHGVKTPSVFYMNVGLEDDRSCHDIYHEYYLVIKEDPLWQKR